MLPDAGWISDLFAGFGPVLPKRMFGGVGIFADGFMIGLVMGEEIYLRTDDATRDRFVAEGSRPFSYDRAGGSKTVITGYYTLPARLYDDTEALGQCARAALEEARLKASQRGRGREGEAPRSAPGERRRGTANASRRGGRS